MEDDEDDVDDILIFSDMKTGVGYQMQLRTLIWNQIPKFMAKKNVRGKNIYDDDCIGKMSLRKENESNHLNLTKLFF